MPKVPIENSLSDDVGWFKLAQDVRNGNQAASAPVFEQALLTLLSTKSDSVKVNVLIFIQENVALLFTEERRLREFVRCAVYLLNLLPAEGASHFVKGNTLVALTTILLDRNCIFSHPDLFEDVVQTLAGVIANVNGASDRFTRQQACECLREIEMTFPGILHPYVADVIPLPARDGSHSEADLASPDPSLAVCADAERSHVAQAYTTLTMTVLEHAATRRTTTLGEGGGVHTVRGTGCLAPLIRRAKAPVSADTSAQGSTSGPVSGDQAAPGLGGRADVAESNADAESSPTKPTPSNPSDRGSVATRGTGTLEKAATVAPESRSKVIGPDPNGSDGAGTGASTPVAAAAPAAIRFAIKSPRSAAPFSLPFTGSDNREGRKGLSLPLPGSPAYSALWPRQAWRCDRSRTWAQNAATQGTSLPSETIRKVMSVLSQALNAGGGMNAWGRALLTAKMIPFAHSAGLTDSVFRHHTLPMAHASNPLLLCTAILVHAGVVGAFGQAEEVVLADACAALARDPSAPLPHRLLALRWIAAFPARAGENPIGQSTAFAILHRLYPKLLPKHANPLPLRVASLSLALSAFVPDPRSPCAPPPGLVRLVDACSEISHAPPHNPEVAAVFSWLFQLLCTFPHLCLSVRPILHRLLLAAPRLVGPILHLLELLLTAEPGPERLKSSSARKAAASASRLAAIVGKDPEAGPASLWPLRPAAFGSTVTRAVSLVLTASFVPFLASLRPRCRLASLLPLATHICSEPAVNCLPVLAALSEWVDEDPCMTTDRDWCTGHALIGVARAALRRRPVETTRAEASRLLLAIAQHHGDADVRDCAARTLRIASHANQPRLRKILKPRLAAARERALRGSSSARTPASFLPNEAAETGHGTTAGGTRAGAQRPRPLPSLDALPKLVIEPDRSARTASGLDDGSCGDVAATIAAAQAAVRALDAAAGGPGWGAFAGLWDCGADGETVAEARNTLAQSWAAAAGGDAISPCARATGDALRLAQGVADARRSAAAAGAGAWAALTPVCRALGDSHRSAVSVGRCPQTVTLPLVLWARATGPGAQCVYGVTTVFSGASFLAVVRPMVVPLLQATPGPGAPPLAFPAAFRLPLRLRPSAPLPCQLSVRCAFTDEHGRAAEGPLGTVSVRLGDLCLPLPAFASGWAAAAECRAAVVAAAGAAGGSVSAAARTPAHLLSGAPPMWSCAAAAVACLSEGLWEGMLASADGAAEAVRVVRAPRTAMERVIAQRLAAFVVPGLEDVVAGAAEERRHSATQGGDSSRRDERADTAGDANAGDAAGAVAAVVRLAMFLPPDRHFLLRLEMGPTETVARVRVDRWELLAEVDAMVDEWEWEAAQPAVGSSGGDGERDAVL